MQASLHQLANSNRFTNFITATIILAGIVVGIETYPSLVDSHGGVLHLLDKVILAIFVFEIAVKMGAEGSRPLRYFRDPWNVFDFIIVAAAFLPFGGNAVTVLRLLRLLRVLKLIRALPKLQVLVGALLKSIPAMGYVSALLLLLFYIYAVAAVFFFSGNDPIHFETLQLSMLSLFRVVTLEDWTDIMYINMYGCDEYGYSATSMQTCSSPEAQPLLAALFFVTFVLIGTMVFLNLFIGVIMTGMDEARNEAAQLVRDTLAQESSSLDDVENLSKQVESVQELLTALQRRLEQDARPKRHLSVVGD